MRSTAARFWSGRAALARLCVLAAPLALCGCVDTAADLAPNAEGHHQFARREGASLAQASVAIVSVEGAPDAVAARFSQALEREARARDIVVVDAAKARYLVRGYLSAEPTEDGAAIEYVWDVFTADKQRAQRLSDVIAVKGSGDDPLGAGRRSGADQRRRQERRRSRRLSLQHPRGGRRGAVELRGAIGRAAVEGERLAPDS